jgi:hypothetical protein
MRSGDPILSKDFKDSARIHSNVNGCLAIRLAARINAAPAVAANPEAVNQDGKSPKGWPVTTTAVQEAPRRLLAYRMTGRWPIERGERLLQIRRMRWAILCPALILAVRRADWYARRVGVARNQYDTSGSPGRLSAQGETEPMASATANSPPK